MNDWPSFGALLSKGIYMGHHIVPDNFFPRLSDLIIDIILKSNHLIDLFLLNWKPQLFFRLSQRNP